MRRPGRRQDDEVADFGFREVPADEKVRLVQGVFDSVATRYDLMNDLMSLGIHRLWKSAFIDMLRPRHDMHLLDVAGGTGDIAFRFLERGGGRVTVCDLTEEMVTVGRDRAIDRGIVRGIDWVVGDAEALPIANTSVDAYSIAFGLRNVTRIDRALEEARRVLKPGGRFLCLEFSRLAWRWLEPLYDRYSFSVLPALGQWVVGDRESYEYLAESIRRFPAQDDLVARITAAGLAHVTYFNLSGGIAAIHSAWRI